MGQQRQETFPTTAPARCPTGSMTAGIHVSPQLRRAASFPTGPPCAESYSQTFPTRRHPDRASSPQRFRSACGAQTPPASSSAPSAGDIRVFDFRHCSVTASASEQAPFLRDIPRKVPSHVTIACHRVPDPSYFPKISLKQHRNAEHQHVLFSTKTTSTMLPRPALPGSSSKDTALFSASPCFHLP